MPEDEIDAALRDAGEEPFELWRENAHALECFLAVRRQWRVGPMGQLLGLDMPGVEAVLRMRHIDTDAELLDDLAVIEDAVLEVLNKHE